MRKTENIINRTGINKTECKKNGHSKENKIPGVKCTPKIELYLSNFKGALHWWNGSLFFLIIILGITLGIFAGCKNIFVPEPPATPEAAGPGGGITVPLRLFTGSARSVMPEMESLTWEITATSDGAEATVLGEYPDFKIYFPFKGTWDFVVKGKSGTEPNTKEIFTGNTTLEITGSTVSISIPLSPGDGMKSGNGTIELTMTVPTDVIKVMYKLDSDAVFAVLAPSGGSCSLNKAGVSAGPHTLSLYFLDGNGMTVYMCTETVNVWSGVTSNQWIKTNGEEYINDKGEFVITKEMVNEFVKTMGSVVFVDESVGENTPATGSIYAPVNSVSTAVDILRKANPDENYSGTIMVSGETTIDREIEVKSGESLTIKGTGENASIKNTSGRVFKITGGSLTLGENITLTGIVTDDNGGAVYVNGGNFTMESGSTIADSSVQGTSASGGGVYVMNGTFIMEDGSKITGSSATVSGGGVAVSTGGTFTMRGGTIDGTGASSNAESGGGVEIHDAIFTMEGGTITGNNATYGGGVRVDSGEFIMKDGTISDNNATNLGGGVCVINGSFTMSDTATIQGNTATTHGGGVYVNGRNFEMIGGTIGGTDAGSANSAQYGGAVYVNGGAFTMESGSKITGSRATGTTASGGAVYVAGGTFTMNGTAILQGNTATTHGGGVHILSGGTFIMNGGTIDGTIGGTAGNTAENGGGVFVSGGTFNMYDGTISGNTVTESGGGVCISGGTFTMSDSAVISGNTATRSGGGVFVSGSGNFIMEGGTIGGTGGESHNSAENGGGVYIHNGAFTMSDGSISGNTATDNGGGVYVGDGTFTMSGGAVISGNNAASSGGGVYVYETGKFTMEGGTIGGATANTATQNGGGVYIHNGTFTMSGGAVISKNFATSSSGSGGGVYVGGGTFTLSGSPNISGNYRLTPDNSNNVYLAGTKTISIGTEGLTGGTIGVTAETITSGGSVQITDKDVTGADGIFTSDNTAYSIVESTDAVYLSDTETVYVANSGTETFGTFEAALDAVNNSADGGTITLLKDIDSNNAVFEDNSFKPQPITFTGGTKDKPIILDLNGYTIDRALGTAQVDGTVISVSGALKLKDSTGSGKITGGNNNNSATTGTWGGGVCVLGGAFFTMEGGNISCNLSEIGGGGVYVCNGGSFTMTGGTIGGSGVNDANMDKSTSSSGGGVFVNGEFTMSGGTITGNITDANGGGVAVTEHGTFTMSGTAVISANKASYGSGGGVYVFGNFTMTGGTIGGTGGGSPNSAQYGGGVYVWDGTFTMNGGIITGNTATQNGGGVYVSSTGSFTLGPSSAAASSPVVSGNTKTGNSTNNVYLDNTSHKTLFITGKLEKTVDSGNIGISLATPQEFTSGWSTSGSTDSTFFFSDDRERNAALSGSELSLNLVRVEGGSCTLNGTEVTLSSFWISPYEVTQEEFESVMTGNQNGIAPNPSHFPNNPVAGEVQERRPVEQVRWYDAIVYCNLLSIKEGLNPCYTIKGSTDPATWGISPTSKDVDWDGVTCDFDANGYRLPTEAEWEYAARGGKPGMTDGSWNNTYSGSNTIDDVAWYGKNSDWKTHEVGKIKPMPWGFTT